MSLHHEAYVNSQAYDDDGDYEENGIDNDKRIASSDRIYVVWCRP